MGLSTTCQIEICISALYSVDLKAMAGGLSNKGPDEAKSRQANSRRPLPHTQ
ncbi:hypothetical protein MGG_17971 [Pyricularia oryzae 70-15]|uniref:Uncharacterized protein n=3 Tax=Pyricularia oryzae TaxID=318829 RepID=G5EHH2_PYRO7|nr:uncharacterized protein MGG_17971 [Pyricularia oryzae 70-15]EAQ71104.1 hypothetical protein MGCH7_ch7g511 [Pyricularia oryzae 70-15]EHA46245.1 hypothetical protein MGG_17971 [Pyricularia oryzae 70-15]ELQ36156.1 hypothetical protein OOU_Y34scaffold00666g17 [Pyricularia oryzae Y34]